MVLSFLRSLPLAEDDNVSSGMGMIDTSRLMGAKTLMNDRVNLFPGRSEVSC